MKSFETVLSSFAIVANKNLRKKTLFIDKKPGLEPEPQNHRRGSNRREQLFTTDNGNGAICSQRYERPVFTSV